MIQTGDVAIVWMRWNIRVQEFPVLAENHLQFYHQIFLVRELGTVFPNQRNSSLVFPAYCSNLILKSLLGGQVIIHSMSAASAAFLCWF